MPTILGTEENDSLTAIEAETRLYAQGGDDTLRAANGDYMFSELYGGDGNDVLIAPDSNDTSLFGGWGDDVYVITWKNQSEFNAPSVDIFEELGSGSGGVDTLDLSAVVDDISQLRIHVSWNWPSLNINVFNKSGTEIGSISINGDVEKLKIGDSITDLPAIDEKNKNHSRDALGATDGNDFIEGGSFELSHLYGFAGDDTLRGNDPGAGSLDRYRLFGGDGDDVLDPGSLYIGTSLIGGDGNDTYVINKQLHAPYAYQGVLIYEYGNADGGDNDVLDLTAVAVNSAAISFEEDYNGTLHIRIEDAQNDYLGSIEIYGDHEQKNFVNIEKLIIGDEVFDLTAFSSIKELETFREQNQVGADQHIIGGAGSDTFLGDDGNDTLSGMAGDDYLHGGEGKDDLLGGAGNDRLVGWLGDDLIIGGPGADGMYGEDGNDQLWAGADDDAGDRLVGGDGADTMGGGAGNDFMVGDLTTVLTNTTIPDAWAIAGGNDVMFGGAGDDIILGGGWADHWADSNVSDPFPGEKEFDDGEQIALHTDDNIIWGGTGDDSIYGSGGDDQLGGGADNDILQAHGGDDALYGGKGNYADTLDGGGGADTLYGGGGDDSLVGGAGDDLIFNGGGTDTVFGGSGADTLWGGPGNDILTSGSGADVFAFASGNGKDTITDFDSSSDKLDLTGFDITDLASVASSATVGGVSGVRLVLDASTEVFLEQFTLGDINNGMALL